MQLRELLYVGKSLEQGALTVKQFIMKSTDKQIHIYKQAQIQQRWSANNRLGNIQNRKTGKLGKDRKPEYHAQ